MNMNLQDIQQDIQRLATQQNQIQAQQMQAQQLLQAQQIANMLNQVNIIDSIFKHFTNIHVYTSIHTYIYTYIYTFLHTMYSY